MREYIPSYDFTLFDVRPFSPLQAQEFGASTSFNASDPASFVDFALNQFYALTQPRNARPFPQSQFPTEIGSFDPVDFFQDSTGRDYRLQVELEKTKRRAEMEAAKDALNAQAKQCPAGYKPVSVFGLFSYCGKEMVSDDSSVGTTTPTGERIGDATKKWLAALPAGSGIFLIAVVIIILLLLFARK